MKIAYIRVSSIDQNEQRQIEEMKKFGAEKNFHRETIWSNDYSSTDFPGSFRVCPRPRYFYCRSNRPTWKKLRRNHCFSQLPKEEKRAADHHQSTDHG